MRILSVFMLDPASARQPNAEEIQRMVAHIDGLRQRGILIDTGGVEDGALELRVTRKNGKDTVTDGPFTEAKEVVGGYALLEVSGRDEAIELTRQFLDVAGKHDGTCVLHEVTSA